MIKQKVKSLLDQTLNSGVKIYTLTKGEVFTGEFKSRLVLDEFVRLNLLCIVPDYFLTKKEIPIIRLL
jgi:hypothetical protein